MIIRKWEDRTTKNFTLISLKTCLDVKVHLSFLFVFFTLSVVLSEASAGDCDINLITALGHLTDVIGLNQYYGWYEGKVEDFGRQLDHLRKEFPKYRILTSEYGAGAVKGRHSDKPHAKDFSEEYQLFFHKAYFKQIKDRPWYAGGFIWNQFDFGAEWRSDGIAHLNNKGLMDFYRQPKLAYSFYRHEWAKQYNCPSNNLTDLEDRIRSIKEKLHRLHESSTRSIIPLKTDWYFELKDGRHLVKKVRLPHSWNVRDAFDSKPGYFRGVGIYSRVIRWPQISNNQILRLNINGAGQRTRVIVDGKLVSENVGMFLGFKTDVTAFALEKKNSVLVIEVDNREDISIPPLSTADYNIYGGLYRPVELEILPKIHIKRIKINTQKKSLKKYALIVELTLNQPLKQKGSRIRFNLYGFNGIQVPLRIKNKQWDGDKLRAILIPEEDVKEWSPDAPNLYILQTSLHLNGHVLDEIKTGVGFKTFSWPPGKLPILNGKRFHFRGTNRHQDKARKANALTLSDHITDFLLIKDMGANAVRLAHYPQAVEVLDLCDILGLLVWEEIPVTSGIPAVPAKINNELRYVPEPLFLENAKKFLTNMILRDYNHVSIIFWGLGNELLTEHASKWRINVAQELLRQLNAISKDKDPYRLTIQAE